MRNEKLKVDITIRMDGVRLAKGKNMNVNDAIEKINKTASKKITGTINRNLFGGIVTSIACFGLFYQVVATSGIA